MMKIRRLARFVLTTGLVLAQRETRTHTANESRDVRIIKATENPPAESDHHFEVYGPGRVMTANG